VAAGYLSLAPQCAEHFALAMRGIPALEREIVTTQIARALNAPLQSSMGRLFDAAAAVLGVRQRSFYEGQAAMELEALAEGHKGMEFHMPVTRDAPSGRAVIDPLPLLAELGARAIAGGDIGELAASFHESVAAATASVARYAADAAGIATVAVGGGVFQNARLMSSLRARLQQVHLRVLVPRALPANDGGISYGQAAVAAARLAASSH
jgi:hydrogenase maturation protein HypF